MYELLRRPISGRHVERRAPIISLKVNVTASSNELLRHDRMPTSCPNLPLEAAPILRPKINVIASFKELFVTAACPFLASKNRVVAPCLSW
jgi:hypothetical protein